MKLTKVLITEFQSVLDSTEFNVGDVTCLVGKNEAGKTALLKGVASILRTSYQEWDPKSGYELYFWG